LVPRPAQRAATTPAGADPAGAGDRSRRPLLYAAAILLGVVTVVAVTRTGQPAAEAYAEAADDPSPASDPAMIATTAAEPPVQPAADLPPAAAELPTSIAPVEPGTPAHAEPEPSPTAPSRYLLEVVSRPEGARITVGSHTLVAPGHVDLGALPEPLHLRAEKEGYTPAGITIDRLGFMLDEGAMRRRVILKLNEAPEPDLRKAPGEPRAKTRAQQPKRVVERAPEVAGAATPVAATPAAATPASAQAAEVEATKPAATHTPIQAAVACLATGDNACVVKTLEGKATTAQELELLIETYRTLGNGEKAEKYMKLYVDKHPDEKRAIAYRRVLEHQGAAP
jgi:hypothetical protein